jgi:hypothetical protein
MIDWTIQVAHVFKKVFALGYADIFIETYRQVAWFRKYRLLWAPALVERYIPAMTDFTMMVEDTSYMFVTDLV